MLPLVFTVTQLLNYSDAPDDLSLESGISKFIEVVTLNREISQQNYTRKKCILQFRKNARLKMLVVNKEEEKKKTFSEEFRGIQNGGKANTKQL